MGALVCTNLETGASREALDVAKACSPVAQLVWALAPASSPTPSQIHFNHIPDEAIRAMVEEGFVFNCAGGLMVEHPQCAPYIALVEGTMDSVMGIEPSLVAQLTQELLAA